MWNETHTQAGGQGFVLVLSGPSGVGKGTLCHKLMKARGDVIYSISATSRQMRPGERDGVDYFFTDPELMKERIQRGDFLEHAFVHNNYYGTPRDFVDRQVGQGKVVILEIDVQGALQVKENTDDAVYVFVLPPDMDTLRQRIIGRGTETEADIALRLKNAEWEIERLSKYDYAIINDDIDLSTRQLESIIDAEKLRVKRQFKEL